MSEPHSPETKDYWTTAQADPILSPLLEAGIVSDPSSICPGCGEPTETTHWRYDPTLGRTVHVEQPSR